MNEQEFTHALRGAMTATDTPPPMDSAEVLEAARRAQRRRRASWGTGGTALAVAVVAAGAMVIPRGDQAPVVAGGQPGAAVPTSTGPTASVKQTSDPSGKSTETSWPNGQTDRTASKGPRADLAVQLLDVLTSSIPAGMDSPIDLKATGERHGELRNSQAQFADKVNGVEVWEYLAELPVGTGTTWGRLLAETHTEGNPAVGDGCDLSPNLWGMPGGCEEIVVGGKKVGVFTRATDSGEPGMSGQFDQWAGYRYPDGTVVFVAQAKKYEYTSLKPLAELPFSKQRLAELVVDPRFGLK